MAIFDNYMTDTDGQAKVISEYQKIVESLNVRAQSLDESVEQQQNELENLRLTRQEEVPGLNTAVGESSVVPLHWILCTFDKIHPALT